MQTLKDILNASVDKEQPFQEQWHSFFERITQRNDSLLEAFLETKEQSITLEQCAKEIQESIATIQRSSDAMIEPQNEALIDISNREIQIAKQWNDDTNMIMVYPCKDLDSLYIRYTEQPKDQKLKADWKCMELFGVNNDQLYELLKSNDKEIINVTNKDDLQLTTNLIQLHAEEPSDYLEERTIQYNEQKIIKELNNRMRPRTMWEFMYAPYFTPREIENLRGAYSETVDIKYNTIFQEYKNYYYGYENEYNIVEWKNEIDKLFLQLEYAESQEKKDIIKESLLTIGWNPEIPFSYQVQTPIRHRLESLLMEEYKNVQIYDIHSIYEETFGDEEDLEGARDKSAGMLYPIHIVLVEGKSLFSNLVTKVTKGPFSHAAIAMGDDFNRLYSFNINPKEGGRNGLSLESVKRYPKDSHMGVFTFFVKKDAWDKINQNLQYFVDHMRDTSYSVLNVILFPFRKIGLNRDLKMICSQFVDKILKLSNINLLDKDSDKVGPNDFYQISIKNSKIYQIYDGQVKAFNDRKAKRAIDRMRRKATPIVESVIDAIYAEFTYPEESCLITEARKIPIQFNDNGDLLLSKPDSVMDLNQEYFNSHRLLLEYEKAPEKNIEGMKYELARLYYINHLLEKRIYSNGKRYQKYRDDYIRTRARVLNDFKKYMNMVLKQHGDFNFSNYYEESPFYHNTIEVKSSTMRQLKQILRDIL